MNALVTGAAGFIGSHVTDALVRGGADVVAMDDLSGGFMRNVPEGARFVKGSICDYPLVQRLFAEHRFDTVYHLAAYAAEGLSHFIRRFNYDNNLLGSAGLINQSVLHGVQHFVFTSSIAVYGEQEGPMDEDRPPTPMDPYGVAKYAVELDLQAAHAQFGLPYVIFRPHNVYGERQNIADRYRNVIGIFMNQVMRDEPLTIFGDGAQSRAFTHVSDVAPIIAAAPQVPAALGQVFNVGGDATTTVGELARKIVDVMGHDPGIRNLPERHEAKHAFASHDKVREVFGLGEALGLDAGLARMAAWVRTVGPSEPSAFADIEVPIGLPPNWRPR